MIGAWIAECWCTTNCTCSRASLTTSCIWTQTRRTTSRRNWLKRIGIVGKSRTVLKKRTKQKNQKRGLPVNCGDQLRVQKTALMWHFDRHSLQFRYRSHRASVFVGFVQLLGIWRRLSQEYRLSLWGTKLKIYVWNSIKISVTFLNLSLTVCTNLDVFLSTLELTKMTFKSGTLDKNENYEYVVKSLLLEIFYSFTGLVRSNSA